MDRDYLHTFQGNTVQENKYSTLRYFQLHVTIVSSSNPISRALASHRFERRLADHTPLPTRLLFFPSFRQKGVFCSNVLFLLFNLAV